VKEKRRETKKERLEEKMSFQLKIEDTVGY